MDTVEFLCIMCCLHYVAFKLEYSIFGKAEYFESLIKRSLKNFTELFAVIFNLQDLFSVL